MNAMLPCGQESRLATMRRLTEPDARGIARWLIHYGSEPPCSGQLVRGRGASLAEALRWAGFAVQTEERPS